MVHEKEECDIETLKKMSGLGMAWRISASVVSFFAWLAFFIIWLAFYAGDYNGYENIAIILLSIIAFVALNAVVWIPFGIRFADEGQKHKMKAADIVSCLAGIAWVAFLIVWLVQYAGDYDIYQNLAVVIVSILVFGGVSGAAHALSWARHPDCT